MSLELPTEYSDITSNEVDVMFAARESSMGNPELLEGMIYQTLGPHSSDPVVNEVLALGLEPLLGHCPYPHHASLQSHTKSVAFTRKNYAFLYALGSAAAANNTQGENQFVETLCDTLVALKPRQLHIHEFPRILRSADWAGKLMRTLNYTGTVVYSGGAKIDLRDATGRMQFQLFTLLADQERIRILGRLFGGLVNKHKRGLWIAGPESVPPGYKLVDETAVLDPTQVQPIRHLLGLMADLTLSNRHVMDLAGKAGCTSPTLQRLHGTEATFTDTRRADSKIRTLLDYIDLWESGRYIFRKMNPFPGVNQYGEYKVTDQSPPEHYGFVEFPYELELPSGGWASPETFDRARQRGLSRKQRLRLGTTPPTGGAAHRKRRPLAGRLTWENETHQYRLSGNSAFYLLVQREITDSSPWTDDRGRNADRIASIDTQEMHEAIVSSCVAALRHGAGVELIDALHFWKVSDIRSNVINEEDRKEQRLRNEVAQLEIAYSQARHNANHTTDPDLAEDFISDAALLRQQLRKATKELEALGDTPSSLTPESFTSDAAFIGHAIATLATCGARAPAELADQLAQVLEFTDVELDQSARTVTFTYRLLLPADDRVAYFGPIKATVRNRAYPATLKALPQAEQARALLQNSEVETPHHAMRQLAAQLVQAGWTSLAASTISRSGVDPLYRIALTATGDPQPLDDLDPLYVQNVLDTYSSPDFAWNARYHHVDCTTRQHIIDGVVAGGGNVTHEELLARLNGTDVPPTEVNIASRPQHFGRAPVWPPSVTRTGNWASASPRSGRNLVVVSCPHCDGQATKAIRTPETPTGLLCPTCMRMPIGQSPQFPQCYLDL